MYAFITKLKSDCLHAANLKTPDGLFCSKMNANAKPILIKQLRKIASQRQGGKALLACSTSWLPFRRLIVEEYRKLCYSVAVRLLECCARFSMEHICLPYVIGSLFIISTILC